ncbi:MAG: hypothetical protein AAGN15_27505 [Cyanobacteria bacterium J06581_3]
MKAKCREAGLVARANDVKILCQWFSHDVLTLAGPDLAVREVTEARTGGEKSQTIADR